MTLRLRAHPLKMRLGASLSGIHFRKILRGEWTAYSTVCEKERNNLGSDT